MSLRYVSALPTCLRGRLVPRPANSICSQCLSRRNHIQTFALQNDLEQEIQFERATKKPKLADGLSHRPAEGNWSISKQTRKTQRAPALKTTESAKKISSLHNSNAKEVVGKPLELPDFLRTSDRYTGSHDNSALRSQKQVVKAENREQKRSWRYTEWEELHDRFLQVRRSTPDETAHVFAEQISFAKQFLRDELNTDLSEAGLRDKWDSLTFKEQLKTLPKLFIGSMATSASQALFVLKNIENMPLSFLIRMNCLRSIALMYWKELRHDPQLQDTYNAITSKLRSPDSWPHTKLPAALLQNLLYWSNPEQCQKIIRDFSTRYPNADQSSTIAIIDHFLRLEDREQAFEYFSRLPSHVLSRPNKIVTSLRDRLLKLDVVTETDTGINFKYLPQVLALGVPSDESLHNTVIDAAVLNGMPHVAWDLYQYLEASSFRSNARSHLVLLHDAFQRRDLQRVNILMTSIHKRKDLIADRYLVAFAMNILRNISCYEKGFPSEEANLHVMALYDRAYDRNPLIKLNIAEPLSSAAQLPQPPATLLAFTIWTYILIQRDSRDVVRLWERIKALIRCGDSSIIDAAEYDIIYNAMIIFYARHASTLGFALDVRQYMLSNGICAPTPRTWSILFCAFLRHGHLKEAEKILKTMVSEGFEVDKLTKNFGSYIPLGHNLLAMAERLDRDSNERDLPAGFEQLLSASQSLSKSGPEFEDRFHHSTQIKYSPSIR